MQMTDEMKEMLERTMEQYFCSYWNSHATPEQEERRVREGKTFKGAYHFAHTVANHFRNKANGENCVAMPDELAYWILMHYMENEQEGAEYKSPEEIEAEKNREIAKAQERQRKLEEKAAKENEGGSLIPVTADDIRKREEEAKVIAETRKIEKEALAKAKASQLVAEKVSQMSLL